MDNDQILALIKDALAFEQKIEALGLDSIATMEMVNFVEEKVDATFPDEELAKVQTVRDLAGLIRDGRVSAG
jgi:acyl carrier protein